MIILKEKLKADDLKAVQQRLSEEMRRLLSQSGSKPPPNNAVIGGIPVDSEYIIFIVDTSGSMQSLAWPLVVRKVEEVLSIYPAVKGIQVMNDMGRYMFETYKGHWIPDSPARRKAIVDRIKTWKSFSNSSPVEGVVAAIRKFYRADRRISLYIFGDDFTGSNMDDVIEEVAVRVIVALELSAIEVTEVDKVIDGDAAEVIDGDAATIAAAPPPPPPQPTRINESKVSK